MSQRLGSALITADGLVLETLPGASIDIGGKERKPVVGSNSVHGFAEVTKEAMVECEISVGPETSLEQIRSMTDVTINFQCDTGQAYIVRNAFVVDTLKLTEGEGGKVPIKFAGPPAEELAS